MHNREVDPVTVNSLSGSVGGLAHVFSFPGNRGDTYRTAVVLAFRGNQVTYGLCFRPLEVTVSYSMTGGQTGSGARGI